MKEQDYLRLLNPENVHTSVFERKFMYLSDIIDPIYHEYAIRLERSGHTLDLDVIRPHHQIENFAEIAKILVSYFEYALTVREKSNIVISMNTMKSSIADIRPVEYYVTIKDTGNSINIDQRERFSTMGAKVRTRVGFGTSIAIPIIEPYDKI
ncbi:MAG: hypothetical protein Q4E47_01355 [Candidatus Saccharibacteria bacterium]|nr:hypothetical protein [Candidatus Saccharibacteria bacterium]